MAVSHDFHTFTVLGVSAGVPSLAYGAKGPTSWSSEYIEARDITLVYLAKVVFNLLVI